MYLYAELIREQGDERNIPKNSPFDRCRGSATRAFIDPTQCFNLEHEHWKDIQQYTLDLDQEAIVQRLRDAGIQTTDFAVCYLTEEQWTAIMEEISMAADYVDVVAVEAAKYYLRDCLNRAKMVNSMT